MPESTLAEFAIEKNSEEKRYHCSLDPAAANMQPELGLQVLEETLA